MSTSEPAGQAFSGGHGSRAFVPPLAHPCLWSGASAFLLIPRFSQRRPGIMGPSEPP